MKHLSFFLCLVLSQGESGLAGQVGPMGPKGERGGQVRWNYMDVISRESNSRSSLLMF